ncbi:MAG: ABC transporter substrate-binding protein [Alphaproteobacteria bacterium]|nr:ABC transporter substrate-binding protein [Alphaproteobacteria bacterium]MBV9815034.1 ABC transporter substrate-binding protein [Alphaproteobacteria bacterium]
MRRITRRSILAAAPAGIALAAPFLLIAPARAAKQYGPGVTDTEIKIGNTCFYSGPASSYGTIGKAETAYFKMLNDQGGVNGRKIIFLSYDDAYSPPKTVEQTRKLVEEDGVLLMLNPLGTPTNTAIQHYLNQKKVPQLFAATGATKWDDPKHFPWTIGWQPNYQMEGRAYAAYVLEHKPDGKVGVLYQNDDFGKDYLKGVKDGLGDKAKSTIVVEASYETTDPTIDSQIIGMKSAGVDVFVNTAIPKFAAQAIRKAVELEWKPLHILSGIGNSVAATLKPAGLENAKDIVSDFFLKDPTDPQWKDDQGYKDWVAFMDKYYPEGDKSDVGNVVGPSFAQTFVQVVKQCGDELTRENVMKQAANLHDFRVPMLLPGITINTSPTDFAPIKQIQMARFDGERWQLFGPLINGAVNG